MSSVKIRSLSIEDAESIASLHFNSFKSFFLTSLGRGFLYTFYRAVLNHPHGLGVGLFKDELLLGFAVGTTRTVGFYKKLIRSGGIFMLFAAFPRLISSPSKFRRLLISIATSNAVRPLSNASLLSICVDTKYGSNGYGRILLNEFETQLSNLGEDDLTLTTDTEDNEHVNAFYIKNKYAFVGEFLQGNRKMNLYYKKIIR